MTGIRRLPSCGLRDPGAGRGSRLCVGALPRTSSSREAGQAIVETVGMLPVLAAVALAAGQALAAGAAHELAGTAAQAGAMALVQGGDPQAAARDAVPGWSRERMRIRVDGRRVHVRMSPLSVVPGASDRLATDVVADAGPRE